PVPPRRLVRRPLVARPGLQDSRLDGREGALAHGGQRAGRDDDDRVHGQRRGAGPIPPKLRFRPMEVIPPRAGSPGTSSSSSPESRGAPANSFRLLDADRFEDRAAWLAHWDEWPDREIMAHPDYARLFARPQDRVLAAALRSGGGGILFPVILRPMSEEPWARGWESASDLTTPYGYGGPFAWGVTAAGAGAVCGG